MSTTNLAQEAAVVYVVVVVHTDAGVLTQLPHTSDAVSLCMSLLSPLLSAHHSPILAPGPHLDTLSLSLGLLPSSV